MNKPGEKKPSGFWLITGFLSILLLTIFLRFYNYNNRWRLEYDQAHDVLVSREALRQHKLPLLGPFSSAGPFQTGGQWYWLIMAGVILSPDSVISPWVFTTFLSVFFVIIIMLVALELRGYNMALIAGLLSAVSTSEVAQSTNLTNQSPLALISLLAIWSSILYLRKKKRLYLFGLSLAVGLAPNIHLQGIALTVLLILTILFSGFRYILVAISGLFISSLPMIIYDSKNGFFNISNMIIYYFHNPNQISYELLGRRWLTYLFNFWPQELTYILGGYWFTGIMIIALVCWTLFNYRSKLNREIFIIGLSLIFSIVLLRYVRTPIFSSYLMFLHPFILILVSWFLTVFAESKVRLGIMLFVIIFISSFIYTWKDITTSSNATVQQLYSWVDVLETKFPQSKFRIYDYNYRTVNKSVPLSLFFEVSGKSDARGLQLGVRNATVSGELGVTALIGRPVGLQVVDLSASTAGELASNNWIPIDAGSIYRATEEWRK